MNQLAIVKETLERKRESESRHIRDLAESVLFANFKLGIAELVERTHSLVQTPPQLIKMRHDGNGQFRVLTGAAALGQNTLSIHELVAMDGEDARSALTVLGSSQLAKTVKAVQHLHRIHPHENVLDLKKAVEATPDIVSKPLREQVQHIEQVRAQLMESEAERYHDIPRPSLTPGRR